MLTCTEGQLPCLGPSTDTHGGVTVGGAGEGQVGGDSRKGIRCSPTLPLCGHEGQIMASVPVCHPDQSRRNVSKHTPLHSVWARAPRTQGVLGLWGLANALWPRWTPQQGGGTGYTNPLPMTRTLSDPPHTSWSQGSPPPQPGTPQGCKTRGSYPVRLGPNCPCGRIQGFPLSDPS